MKMATMLFVLALGLKASADDFAGLCASRTGIERVYYLNPA